MSISWGLLYSGSSTATLLVHDYQQATFGDDDEFVRESIPVDVVEASAALLDAKLTLLHRLSGAVNDYQKTKVANQPVYLTGTVDGVAWRSEIVSLRVTNASPGAYQDEHASFHRDVVMEVTRRPWETITEYVASIRNANVADWDVYDPATEAGVKIYDGDDRSGSAGSVRTNYLFVKENSLAPSMNMKTPVNIIFGAGQEDINYDEFYIGTKHHCAIAGTESFVDGLLVDLSGTYATTASGDNYYALTFSDGDGDYTPADFIAPSDAIHQENKYYKVFMRTQSPIAYTDLRCRLVLEDRTFTGVDVWTGQWYTLVSGRYLHPLDTLKLPPQFLFDNGYVGKRSYNLRLEFESAVASRTVNIDFVQFVPVDDYAEVKKRDEYSAYTAFGVDDAYNLMVDFSTNPVSSMFFLAAGTGYLPIATTTGYPVMTTSGGAINLMPSQNTYSTAIIVLFTRTGHWHLPDDYVYVNVFYRPRRRAI